MKENSDSLLKSGEIFTSLINLIYKATENYQKIFTQNISQINQTLSLIENNLQAISVNKVKNMKSILNSNQKSFLTYINDTKIALNKILMKSKEISLQIMTYNKTKSSIDLDILTTEITQKENEITKLKNELNYFKDKFNSVNQSFSEAQKTISDLKEENFSFKEKMIENEKNNYIQSKEQSQNSIIKSASSIGIENINNSQIIELKNKIKDLNKEIEKNKQEYNIQISRMDEKYTNLSKSLTKKNQDFTKLQSENFDKIKENSILKNQLEKNNLKENEYHEKIINYQKQIENNEKDLNNKNSEINNLNDNINNNKLLIKSLETEIEKLKFDNNTYSKENNELNKILNDLEICKNEKEELKSELENTKKLMENDKIEYKKQINLMESNIYNNNILINKKDELIEQLKFNENQQEKNEELNTKLEELENIIKQKDDEIKELNNIIEKNKQEENKEISLAKKTILQYKTDNESNMAVIKLLQEQIKTMKREKIGKEENKNNNNSELIAMAEKMLKLEKELDRLRNNNKFNALEKKYNELDSEYKKEKQKYQNEINKLKIQIFELKEQQGNKTNNKQPKKGNVLETSSNFNLEEKYSQTLQNLAKANLEIQTLKKQIEKLEKEKNNKKVSIFECKSVNESNDYEDEIDLIQLKEGVKRKNRSEDLNIDFPGLKENQQKYEELEERFNKLKEQVIPMLKENSKNNIIGDKNNIHKICDLLGTSVNTTNNIIQNYK